jgi:ATP-dependent DNA helicase RecQ
VTDTIDPPAFRTRSARALLKDVFGFDSFRAHQEEIVRQVVAGGDAFVLMPTGGGKSLCYQLPALMRPGTAIVISPLIALMKDQVDALRASGVAAACLNSSISDDEARAVVADLRRGALDLLYVAPERLVMGGFLGMLDAAPVSLFAIDEAHCISQWGHDFRPEYAQLSLIRTRFPGVPVIALTATADDQTRADIVSQLGIESAPAFISSFDRPNIRYSAAYKRSAPRQLLEFLEPRRNESGIVYALSRRRVEEVAGSLRDAGFSAAAYHAGLPSEERSRVHEAFLGDRVDIVVATIAFGMGIDKPDVRFVVHYDMPRSIEGYYQESGRAGRDGLPAFAHMLWSMADVAQAGRFIDEVADPEQRRIEAHKLNAMLGLADAMSCRRRALLGYFGEVLRDDCGNCDVCEAPPETYDGTVDAQKVLSAVFRLGGRFGAGYVVDVLRGSANERILGNGHDTLSVYGIGADLAKDAWSSIIRQLIHRGFLQQDIGDYSTVKLLSPATAVLRGEKRLTLARPPAPRPKAERVARVKGAAGSLEPVHTALFECLRALRREIASTQGVPAYVVFPDATLAGMAQSRPHTRAELLAVSGVGQAKLERYGDAFLNAIAEQEAGRAPLGHPPC